MILRLVIIRLIIIRFQKEKIIKQCLNLKNEKFLGFFTLKTRLAFIKLR